LLRKFFEDEEIAADFGHTRKDYEPRWSTRPAPGSVELVTRDGFVAEVLPPSAGPFPRDFRFQPPDDVTPCHKAMALGVLSYSRGFFRDWQWDQGVYMDAPDEMPAGSLVAFSLDWNVFGARQSTWLREGGD
jgi:hypothetical protein